MIPCQYIGSIAVVLVVREGKLRSAGEAVPGYGKCCHLPGGCVLPDNVLSEQESREGQGAQTAGVWHEQELEEREGRRRSEPSKTWISLRLVSSDHRAVCLWRFLLFVFCVSPGHVKVRFLWVSIFLNLFFLIFLTHPLKRHCIGHHTQLWPWCCWGRVHACPLLLWVWTFCGVQGLILGTERMGTCCTRLQKGMWREQKMWTLNFLL